MTISEMYHNHVMQCWSSQAEYYPIEVEKTEGCWLHTKNGRKIFDLRSAHECINLGFNHPKVIEVLKEGLEKPIYVTDDFAVESTALLAKKLAEITPGSPNKKVWFGQSGAGSVEAAIKAARFHKQIKIKEKGSDSVQYPYPYKIISRYRAWHGSSMNALSAGGDPRKWFSEPLLAPGFIQAPDAYPYRSPFGEDETGSKAANYLEYMLEMEGGGDFVAAIMVEPVVGSNGIIPAPQAYMKRVREICNAFDVLLIVDETMTGMGRTGKFLSIEHYDIEPDIIIMGKALGVYCPISATIMSEEVSASFDENIFGHGQSYSGHSLGAAAALASIEVLENDVLPEVQEKADYLNRTLNELKKKYSFVGDVRGLGMMWTMELIKNKHTKESFRSFGEKYKTTPVKKLSKYMLDELDIYVPGDKFGLWIVPPLVASMEELDWLITQLDKALNHFKELID